MSVPLRLLRDYELFAGLSEQGLQVLAQIGRMREVPRGMSLFLEGAPGESLYLVQGGQLEVRVGAGEDERVLCYLGKGDHFGELSLLRSGRRAVSTRALSAVRLIEIRRSDFRQLTEEKPQACIKVMLAIFSAVESRIVAIREDILASL